jgi:hypothetical protein
MIFQHIQSVIAATAFTTIMTMAFWMLVNPEINGKCRAVHKLCVDIINVSLEVYYFLIFIGLVIKYVWVTNSLRTKEVTCINSCYNVRILLLEI